MKAGNIQWVVDMDEMLEVMDTMTVESAAEVVEIPVSRYANMTTEERHDYAIDYFRHCPGALDDLMGLPDKVDIPDEVDEEDVADWLSDEYGFCHEGFVILN